MSKKVETSIHIANGGNHSPVNYRKHKNMLSPHPYRLGYLYHIVLTGSEDRNVYRKAVELLCKELRKNGMPCRYKACYERDKFKRFHKHVFILIEAFDFHPDTIIHYRKGHWPTEMLKGLGLGFKIAEPKDEMHQVAGKKVNYAYVPKKASAKLDDCLLWISYLTKVRSKEGVTGQVYTGSTNREGKKPSLPSAPQAEQVAISTESDSKPLQDDNQPQQWVGIKTKPEPDQEAVIASQTHNDNKEANENSTTTQYQAINEGEACNSSTRCNASLVGSRSGSYAPTEARSGSGETSSPRYNDGSGASTPHREGQHEMKLTPAQNYLSTLYERCIDADMNLDAVRLYLLEQGIRKSVAMIVDDLENTYGFVGYASRHPAPQKPDVAEFDALITRTPLRDSRRNAVSRTRN